MQPLQPQPQRFANARAIDTAADLKASYGDNAIIGARAALRAAASSGGEEAVAFWSDVCAVLATDQVLTIHFD